MAQWQADAYLEHLPKQLTSSERQELRGEFTLHFLSGFIYPDGSLIVDNDASLIVGGDAAEQGHKAGQAFRRRCSTREITQTMEAYGYFATEGTGIWSVGFEDSCFRPSNTPNQKWFLERFGNAKYILPKKGEKTDHPLLYRISGFLSPKGEYGPYGNYDHMFYATKVVYIKDGG